MNNTHVQKHIRSAIPDDAQEILPYNEASENGGQVLFYPVHRFRRRNGMAKIQTVKGSKVEIFSPHTSEIILLVP